MKTLLLYLKQGRHIRLVGIAEVYAYSDGTLTARMEHNALMCPSKPGTLAGLTDVLAWIESEVPMCDMNHQHAKLEEWITPETSEHLSAKMVHLWPGDSIPSHTTGPGREEVIVCIYGSIEVSRQTDATPAGANTWETVRSGEAIFIPENCVHEVCNTDKEAPAQYAYVATKRQPCAFGITKGRLPDGKAYQSAMRAEWEENNREEVQSAL